MQINTGIRRILRLGFVYEALQIACGRDKAVSDILKKIPIPPNSSVLDIGCGTGFLVPFLPHETMYTGIDLEPNYIKSGKLRYPRMEFILGGCDQLDAHLKPKQTFDYVIALGLFHHTDDNVFLNSLASAKKHLNRGGQIIVFEPTYISGQGHISKWLMGKDRGQSIRDYNEWVRLFKSIFPEGKAQVFNAYRIPYKHILLTSKVTL